VVQIICVICRKCDTIGYATDNRQQTTDNRQQTTDNRQRNRFVVLTSIIVTAMVILAVGVCTLFVFNGKNTDAQRIVYGNSTHASYFPGGNNFNNFTVAFGGRGGFAASSVNLYSRTAEFAGHGFVNGGTRVDPDRTRDLAFLGDNWSNM